MKIKFVLSTLVLAFFAFLGAGSSDVPFGSIFTILLVGVGVIIVGAVISSLVQSANQKKRLQMIKEDEKNSDDFDRRVFIGDDRCKLYFDSVKKKVMIMRVMTEGIKKEFVDDFEYSGDNLASYTSPTFCVYDSIRRKLLLGLYNDNGVVFEVISITEKDKNSNVTINNTIKPFFRILRTSYTKVTPINRTIKVLINESTGFIVVIEGCKVKNIFNYVEADCISRKTGSESTISTRVVGNYLFVMDDFFKKIVVVESDSYEIFNYSDILDVSYVENGSQVSTKSSITNK